MADETEKTVEKQKAWQFQPGQSGNPSGRPKGAKSKLQECFLSALADDFSAHGKEAVERMRTETPAAYVKAIASLMPKQIEIERPLSDMSDAELVEAVDALRTFLAAQGAGEGTRNKASRESASDLQPIH